MALIDIEIPDEQIEKVIHNFLQAKEEIKEKILDAKESADIIGISPNTLHKYTLKGIIPYHTIKGVRNKLFLRSDIVKIKKENLKKL